MNRAANKHRLLAVATAILVVAAWFSSSGPACAAVLSSDRVDGVSARELGVPEQAMPDVSMKAGVLVTQDGRVIWARRDESDRAMASLTKIMTAVVALEHSKLDEKVTVGQGSVDVGESTSFLRSGESLPMSEMLEALLVKSGNDAAVAIAEHVAGSEEAFVEMMNAKAAELGMTETHFKNSHGLDQKGHLSSASDLAVLARYAMTKPRFREIVATKNARIGSGKRAEKVESTNIMLENYDGANGVKTGWTTKAGYCVIESASRDGIELYAVVLGTTNELRRFQEARELMDFGFAHYRPQRLVSKGTVIGRAPVVDYLDVVVGAEVAEDVDAAVFDLAGPISRTVTVSAIEAPVERGQRIGVATFSQRGEVIASVPLVAVEEVAAPSVLQRVGIALMRTWRRLTGGPLTALPVGSAATDTTP